MDTKMRRWRILLLLLRQWLALHEVVQEVLIAVLVTRLRQVILGHDVVVGMIPLPRKLFPLLSYASFFLALSEKSVGS
jgi:hypothetical protein